MKINNYKSNQAKIIYIILAVLLFFIITLIILEKTGVTHVFNAKTNQTIDQPTDTSIDKEQDSTIDKPDNTQNDTPTSPISSDIILSTNRETDGSITIITQLKNYSDGVCNLTIKNGSSTYTQTAPVLYQIPDSTCEGFNIPADSVAKGTWQISLSVTSKGKVNTNTTSMEVR